VRLVRITGGEHRSRPLRAPRGSATRPTSDRVREALFSILASMDAPLASEDGGARVLDLYEMGKEAQGAIVANVEALGLRARARLLPTSVERALASLAKTREPFDVVFLDPPYAEVAKGTVARVLGEIVAAGLVAPAGVVVLEHARTDAAPGCPGLTCTSTRRYGDTALSFYALASA
jgi:16S rRNA (guanine966-N2)-methyltransferase